jgi:Tol biopolymer transport system component
MDGGDPVRLAEGFGSDLSPDGKSVLVWLNDPPRVMKVPVGPGLPRPLDLDGITPAWPGLWVRPWSGLWVPPHGDRIALVGHEAGRGNRVWVVGLSGGAPRAITPEGAPPRLAVSPDGRSIALGLAPGTVSIVPTDGGNARDFPGLPENLSVSRWSGDGRSLFLLKAGNWPCQLHRLDLATQRVELWRQVTPADPTGIIHCSYILPSEDGRSYAYSYYRALTDIIVAEGLR